MFRRIYDIVRRPFGSGTDPPNTSGPTTPAGSGTAIVSANGMQLTVNYESADTAVTLINAFTAGISRAPNQQGPGPTKQEPGMETRSSAIPASSATQADSGQEMVVGGNDVKAGENREWRDTQDFEELDWPNGSVIREQQNADDRRYSENKWVWTSRGNSYRQERRTETRACLGVLQCEKCKHLFRPLTDKRSREAQILESPCPNIRCNLVGVGHIRHRGCEAKVFLYKIRRDGRDVKVWEHSGNHTHARPPQGKLSRHEEDALDQQVIRRPDATVFQLRTGDPAPGSVPLAEINPILANPRAARHAVETSKSRLGLVPHSVKGGGLATLRDVSGLHGKLGMRFIVDSSFSGPTYFALETPFMLEIIQESVGDWLSQDESGPDAGRHGFCTDGDHSFFRMGNLLATCAFSTVLAQWVPVGYTWILSLDTDHHRVHFRRLNKHILAAIPEARFHPKYLAAVMDFSQAQRSAHASEYVDAMTSRILGFDILSSEARNVERSRLLVDVSKYQQGCEVHFQRSAMRLKKDSLLVPPHLRDTFQECVNVLLRTRDRNEYEQTMARFRSNFPSVMQGWISWWARPHISAMIFPACYPGDANEADNFRDSEIPHTSNPIETQHSLLHRATGKGYDLIPGIEALFAHVKQLKIQYDAAKKGHYHPSGPRSKSNRIPTVRFDIGDGRAPDTYDTLARSRHSPDILAQPGPSSVGTSRNQVNPAPGQRTARDAGMNEVVAASSSRQTRRKSTKKTATAPVSSPGPRVSAAEPRPEGTSGTSTKSTPSRTERQATRTGATGLQLPKVNEFMTVDGSFPSGPSNAVFQRSLQSYVWSDNSCFYDTTLEVMFRAFVLWPPVMRQEFMEYLGREFRDSSVLLCTIFWHYQNRLKWILGNSRDTEPNVTFSAIHFAVGNVVRDEWGMTDSRGYASALSWFPRAIEDAAKNQISSLFGLQHESVVWCSSGHVAVHTHSGTILQLVVTVADTTVMNLCTAASVPPLADSTSLGEYLKHFIPIRPGGSDWCRGTFMHTLSSGSSICAEKGCSLPVSTAGVRTHWPQVLTVIPETRNDTPEAFKGKTGSTVTYPLRFSLPASFGPHEVDRLRVPESGLVEYQLVGRVLYERGVASAHYTAQVVIGDSAYDYDSTYSNGRLYSGYQVDAEPAESHRRRASITTPTQNHSMAIYHRGSDISTTFRSVSSILSSLDVYSRHPKPRLEMIEVFSDHDSPQSQPVRRRRPTPRKHKSHSVDADSVEQFVHDTVEWTVLQPQEGQGNSGDRRVGSPTPRSPSAESMKSFLSQSSIDDYNCAVCKTSRPPILADPRLPAGRRVVGCSKCNKWSHQDCIEEQFGLPSNVEDPDVRWLCPYCSQACLWNDDMLHQWLLLPTTSSSTSAAQLHYPCQISGIDASRPDHLGLHVTVEWYYGNVYTRAAQKRRIETSIPAHKCARALHNQRDELQMGEISDEQIGDIKWPTRLLEDAVTLHGYSNSILADALEEATSAILAIVTHSRSFPLAEDFFVAIQGLSHGIRRERIAVDFYHNLAMPLLPGDRSIVDVFAEDLRCKLIDTGHTLHDAVFLSTTLGTTLFSLVVLRFYLERSACDDATIYSLLKTGSLLSTDFGLRPFITRHLSIPEAALGAIRQLTEDELHDRYLWRTLLELEESDPIEHDASLECQIKYPIAYVYTSDGTAFRWPESTDTGLTESFPTPAHHAPYPDPHHPPTPGISSPIPSPHHVLSDPMMDVQSEHHVAPSHRRKRSEANSEDSTSAGLSLPATNPEPYPSIQELEVQQEGPRRSIRKRKKTKR